MDQTQARMLIEQRDFVRKQMVSKMKLNDTWYLISMEWFVTWNRYIDELNSRLTLGHPISEDTITHPGPINNQNLLESPDNTNKLRQGLIDRQDYELMPESAYKQINGEYGGGPDIPRKVVAHSINRMNPTTSLSTYVELYPLEFYCYLCKSPDTVIQPSVNTPDTIIYLNSTSIIDDLTEALSKQLQEPSFLKDISSTSSALESTRTYVTDSNKVRYWVHIDYKQEDGEAPPPQQQQQQQQSWGSNERSNMDVVTNENDDDDSDRKISPEMKKGKKNDDTESPPITDNHHTSNNNINNNNNNKQVIYYPGEHLFSGRRMTMDVTDKIDDWTFLRHHTIGVPARNSLPASISYLFPNAKRVHVLVEVKVPTSTQNLSSISTIPSSSTWPRDSLLNRWKTTLQVNDVVDAIDRVNKWYEAQITGISAVTGDISIHYFGWGSAFDIIIASVEKFRMIQPLYSQVNNWRESLQVDDEIEIKIKEGNDGGKWHMGRVCSIDTLHRMVEVFIAMPTRNEKFKKFLYSEDICVKFTHLQPEKVSKNVTDSQQLVPVASTSSNVMTAATGTTTGGYTHNGYGATGGRYSLSNASNWSSYRSHTRGKAPVRGAVGLSNLGNTCFMASMLQCMSNTQVLTEIFLDDGYKNDINTDNPLGKGGKIANVYAKLVRDLWSDQYSVVYPDEFKQVIGEFAQQFAGYQQQDSQEFMCFLLDGLHEDLNRVKKKPFVSPIESKGRLDDLVSRESWRRYLLRNDSFLVDYCFGLSKSHVTCAGCQNQSVTFEAFNSLSLPIPVKNTKRLSMTVFPLPYGSPPLSVTLDVPVTCSFKELKDLIITALYPTYLQPDKQPAGSGSVSSSGYVENPEVDDSIMVNTSDVDNTFDDSVNLGSGHIASGKDKDMVVVSMSTDSSPEYVMVDRDDVTTANSSGNHTQNIHVNNISGKSENGSVVVVDGESNGYNSETDVSMIVETSSTEAVASPAATDMDSSNTTPPLGDIYLHFGVQFASTISGKTDYMRLQQRTFQDTADIHELQRHESLLVFQLQHPVLVTSHYSTSNYYHTSSYTYNSTVKRSNSMETDTASTPSVKPITVDVYLGAWKTSKTLYTSATNTTYQGIAPPHRISAIVSETPKTALDYSSSASTTTSSSTLKVTTNHDVHQILWLLNEPMIVEDSVYHNYANRPYLVYTLPSYVYNSCSPHSLLSYNPLPDDENAFKLGRDDVLVCIWAEAAYQNEHFETTAYDLKTIPSDNSNSELKQLTIYDCLDKYMEREQLTPEQTIYCSKCKQHLAPLKKMDIWSSPEVLILHLKRFQYTSGYMFVHRDKINDLISFPVEGLNLSNYVLGESRGSVGKTGSTPSPPPIYDLYAVSEHSGGLGGGHYTAVCRNFIDGKWYSFNDSHVSETTAEAAVTPRAYVLFYRRRLTSTPLLGAPEASHRANGAGSGFHDMFPNGSASQQNLQQSQSQVSSTTSLKGNHWVWGGISKDSLVTGLEDEKE